MHSKPTVLYTKVGNWWYLPELKILVTYNTSGQIVSTATLDPFCQRTINFFISHPGRFISRQELIFQVWGQPEVPEQQLIAVINTLQQCFFNEGSSEVYLLTIAKTGYRFIAALSQSQLPDEIESWLHNSVTNQLSSDKQAILPNRWLAASLCLALVIGCLASLRFSSSVAKNSEQTQVAKFQQVTNLPGLELYPAISPDGQWLTYLYMDKSGQKENLQLRNLQNGDTSILFEKDEFFTDTTWRPDSKAIIYLVGTYKQGFELRLLELTPEQKDQLLFTIPAGTEMGRMNWSPDGTSLIYPQLTPDKLQTSLWLYSLTTGKREQLTVLPSSGWLDYAPVFSKNSQTVAFLRRYNDKKTELWVLDMPSRETRLLYTLTGEAPGSVDWINHDTELLLPHSDRSLLVIDAESGRENLKIFTEQQALGIRVNGQRIFAVAGAFRHSWIEKQRNPLVQQQPLDQSLTTEKELATSRTIFNIELNPNPAGPIAVNTNRSGSRQVWLYYPDGRQIQLSNFKLDKRITAMVFSPAGTELLVAFDNQLWLLSEHQAARQLLKPGQSGQVPSWSADGRFIYFIDTVQGRNQVAQIDIHSLSQRTLALDYFRQSPDGQYQIFRQHNAQPYQLKFVHTGEVLELPLPVYSSNFPYLVLAKQHLYFLDWQDDQHIFIQAFNLTTKKMINTGIRMTHSNYKFAVSADEQFFYLPTGTYGEMDIVQVQLADVLQQQLFNPSKRPKSVHQ
jgi:Tol biopolymer transport system component/DNA-binding winged helix-turn-helix (wHTH) protein